MRIKYNNDLMTYLALQGCFFPKVYLPAMFHMQTEILDVISGEIESVKNTFYNVMRKKFF